MENTEGFYTMKGYERNLPPPLTASMEDYLEMICRLTARTGTVRVSDLSARLHVRPSSATKMLQHLKEAGCVRAEKYGTVSLTEKGREAGDYLLERHRILHDFLCALNQSRNELEQVEKIEHYLDPRTVENLRKLTERMPGPPLRRDAECDKIDPL